MESKKQDYEYNTLMNMLHVSVSKHLLDEHFTLVWANDFYYDLIGYSKEDYERQYHNQCDLYYHEDPEEWNKIGSLVTRSLQEGKREYGLPTRMRRRDGEYIWVRMSGTFTQEYIDGCQVAYTVMVNINDIIKLQTEQSITYDNLPGFVGRYRVGPDLTFTLLDANERYIEFFGKDCWQSENDPLFRRNLKRNAAVIEAHKDAFLNGRPAHFLTQMTDQHGNEAYLQINASCVEYQGSCPVYLAIYIDITNETELRQMRQQLEEQAAELKDALQMAEHASRAKTDFLSHMSHDIRTPMNAIIGMTNIAQCHMSEPEKVSDCLKKILLSSQHLLGLINDVLDMSRIESGKMFISQGELSLPDLLEDVIAIMHPSVKAKSQQFSIHLQDVRHEQLISDALRLRQIFINILSNASKFTPVGGSITVNVTELPVDDSGIANFSFRFADTGIGMKQEFLEQLFDPFAREQDSRVDKTEGSGLGMAITKKLVELLGGAISVRSQVGQGTQFDVSLPLRVQQVPPSDLHFSNMKIIIADDDAVMCEYMEDTLKSFGVEAESVRSGEEALQRIAEAHDAGRDFNMVFLDWKMPGMDGPRTASLIRRQFGQKLPILIVSAYDWGDIESEAKESGVNGFISKPLFVSTLCHALQKYALDMELDGIRENPESLIDFSGRHFLLMEDNELNQEIAVELLTSAGAQIDCAGDGLIGVGKFVESPEYYYDIILMDVQMPVMNGYEATEKIRSMQRADAKTVKILAMTADAFAEDVSHAFEVGMNGHLAKPLDVKTLLVEVNKVLKS